MQPGTLVWSYDAVQPILSQEKMTTGLEYISLISIPSSQIHDQLRSMGKVGVQAPSVAKNNRDIRLTMVSFMYVVACLFMACLGNSIADRINPNTLLPVDQRTVLPDILLQTLNPYFVYWNLPHDLSDRFITLSVLVILIRLATIGTEAFTAMRRMFIIGGTVYLLRSISVVMTVLPNPLVTCQSTPHSNLFVDALQIFMGKRVSCGDVLFSGHTIIYYLALAMWLKYSAPTSYVSRAIVSFIAYAGMLSLIASSYHYTLDVVVGYIVTNTVWTAYHQYVEVAAPDVSKVGRVLRRLDDAHFHEHDDAYTLRQLIGRQGFQHVMTEQY